MNERIKLKIEREIWPQCISDVTKDTDEVMKNYFDKYKFAQLIVEECVRVAHRYDEPKLSGPGLMIGSMIEQHFGVE